MLQNYKITQKSIFLFLVMIFAGTNTQAQVVKRVHPNWWWGFSGAANFNTYRGLTQQLTSSLSVPTAFRNGNDRRPYGSLLMEYRKSDVIGFMLNVGFDNRGGKFDQVMAPCNCPANLSTNLSYAVIEPSLRIAPFSNAFYLFAGPTIGINISKSFIYDQDKVDQLRGELSDVRKTLFGAQAGLGFDIPLSRKESETQMTLSPFGSFQTDLLQSPRTIESWSIYTIRAGIALKFGTGKKIAVAAPAPIAAEPIIITQVAEKEVIFSVRAPKVVPLNRQVKETFPLRNSVFFDMGSSDIPNRYIKLDATQAAAFKEDQLQENQPNNINSGRSSRQLAVYYNILNITGDRLRANPNSNITLVGSSDANPVEGKLMADNVKQYLVSVYTIDPSRISTEGRDKPVNPSEQPGGTKELDLLREGDRRVNIESASPELLLQVGGVSSPFMRPIQIKSYQMDPLDSHVIFTTTGATELYDSWNVEVKDDQGKIQSYGPYYADQASIPGNTILGTNAQGNYEIKMIGKTKSGKTIVKQSSVSLMKMDDPKQEGLRYSILFDFDKSKTIESYEKFLTEVVAPLIPENGTVIIHGHTDIIGEEVYNNKLSQQRATDALDILKRAIANSGKKGIRFETYGFGEDLNMAPFDNKYPEERFYNRTVIIDIVSNK